MSGRSGSSTIMRIQSEDEGFSDDMEEWNRPLSRSKNGFLNEMLDEGSCDKAED